MSKHLLIAGTGRAGTSFLVRYLTRMGLDTHLSRNQSSLAWDEAAQAGLEDLPTPDATNLPYVIKSPWTYQVIHELLARGTIQFEAVVIPMRDLTEAASSRSIIEMQSLYRRQPNMTELDHVWEHYGHVPGGIVYSLNPVDQARLLAVGLHQLMHALVRADIPIVLLAFPRLIEDGDYLFSKLAPWLPPGTTLEDARAAHAEVADPAKVRVGQEINSRSPNAPGFVLPGPSPDQLDRAALARLLAEVRRDLHIARETATGMNRTIQAHEAALAQKDEALRLAEASVTEARNVSAAVKAQRDDLTIRLAAAETALSQALSGQEALLLRMREESAEAAALRSRLIAIEASSSWRAALSLARAPRLAAAVQWLLPAQHHARAERQDG